MILRFLRPVIQYGTFRKEYYVQMIFQDQVAPTHIPVVFSGRFEDLWYNILETYTDHPLFHQCYVF